MLNIFSALPNRRWIKVQSHITLRARGLPLTSEEIPIHWCALGGPFTAGSADLKLETTGQFWVPAFLNTSTISTLISNLKSTTFKDKHLVLMSFYCSSTRWTDKLYNMSQRHIPFHSDAPATPESYYDFNRYIVSLVTIQK